jgi:hypothetical protein
MAHKKLWHAMTNICALNSKHKKVYGVMDCNENLLHLVAKRHAMISSHK